MLVAIDWCDMKMTERMFHVWIGYTKMQKILDEIKLRQAESHYNWYEIERLFVFLCFCYDFNESIIF